MSIDHSSCVVSKAHLHVGGQWRAFALALAEIPLRRSSRQLSIGPEVESDNSPIVFLGIYIYTLW